jgi:cell division protein FtsW
MEKAKEMENKELNNKNLDFPMLVAILVLLCMGLVMVATASSYYALNNYDDSNYFLSRQAIFAIIGVIAMFIISKIDYRRYKRWAYLGYGLSLALLAAVLIPGIR